MTFIITFVILLQIYKCKMKDAFIQVRIRKELKEDFKKYCKEENLDMSEVITDYVKQLLREYKKEKDQIKIPFE